MDKKYIESRSGIQPTVKEILIQLAEAIENGGSVTVTWNDVEGKPSTFPPESHTHTIAQVDGLQTEIDNIKSRLDALEEGDG